MLGVRASADTPSEVPWEEINARAAAASGAGAEEEESFVVSLRDSSGVGRESDFGGVMDQTVELQVDDEQKV